MTDFEQIYRKYFNDVFLFIRRLSNDENIAEEITSETFFKAMGKIDSFRGQCDIRVWLCQIAKNNYFAYLKKAKRFNNIEDIEQLNDLIAQEPSVEEQAVGHSEAIRVQEVLHTIHDPYKEVFMWRVYAELSFKQIGQMFGKSENWACVTYHRAKKIIKERLEENGNEK